LQTGRPHLLPCVNLVANAGTHHPLPGRRRHHAQPAALIWLGFLLEERGLMVPLGGIERRRGEGSREMVGGAESGRSKPGFGRRRGWRKGEEGGGGGGGGKGKALWLGRPLALGFGDENVGRWGTRVGGENVGRWMEAIWTAETCFRGLIRG
jgi:hypothetical protein